MFLSACCVMVYVSCDGVFHVMVCGQFSLQKCFSLHLDCYAELNWIFTSLTKLVTTSDGLTAIY